MRNSDPTTSLVSPFQYLTKKIWTTSKGSPLLHTKPHQNIFSLKELKNCSTSEKNTEKKSDNIIIYAHNRYHSGVMFGTLQNTLRYSWYTNPENQIISFRTLYEDLNYQIFSIYKISVTTDYMRVLFADDTDKLNFYTMLKDRSIYDFGIELSGNDKIITLSTCADENNRYVVHAVLKN